MGLFSNLFGKQRWFYGNPYDEAKPSRQPWRFGITRKDLTRAEVQLHAETARRFYILVDENNTPVNRAISLNFESGEFSRDIEKLTMDARRLISYADLGWEPHYMTADPWLLPRGKVQFCVQGGADDPMEFIDSDSVKLYHSIARAWRTGGTFKITCQLAK